MHKILCLILLALPAFAAHPRIWLDSAKLLEMRTRWASGTDAQMIALKSQCDAYLGGAVYAPRTALGRYWYSTTGSDGPHENSSDPNIGAGYQGAGGGSVNGYWDSIHNLSFCYQMVVAGPALDATAAANYAAKGSEVLDVMSYRPGTLTITSGSRSGQVRYINDSSFTAGTAWAGASPVVNGSVSAGSTTITLRSLTPSGTILAGDSFNIGSATYMVKANTTANGSGQATVTLAEIHGRGGVNSNSTAASALSDGTAVTFESVVLSYYHTIPYDNFTATISGVGGNTYINGDWTVSWVGGQYGNKLKLVGSDSRNGAIQSPLVHDAMYNQGYGQRFWCVGMAIGYDFLYDALTPTMRTQVADAIVRWIRESQRYGYGQRHVGGNYYMGQSAAMLLGALAIEQEDSRGGDLYTEWYDNEWITTTRQYRPIAGDGNLTSCWAGVFCYGIKSYYNTYVTDSFFPDGSNYGWTATRNLINMVLAVKTAKGIDLTTTPSPAFTWFDGVAKSIVNQTKPNKYTFDTRTELFAAQEPSRVSLDTVYLISYALRTFSSSFAPYFQSYLNAVRPVLLTDVDSAVNPKELWVPAMSYDASATAADYTTLPLSFYQAGSGEFHSRSDWGSTGVFASIIAGPSISSTEGGKDSKDRGSIYIFRGDPTAPASANKMARLSAGTFYEMVKDQNQKTWPYDRSFGTTQPGVPSILYVHHNGTQWRQANWGPGVASVGQTNACLQNAGTSGISRHVDGTTYSYARADGLVGNYDPAGYGTTVSSQCNGYPGLYSNTKPFTSWTREMFHLRPKTILVYDRVRGITDNSWDRYINWGVGKTPTVNNSPPTGMTRYDIADGSFFKGSIFGVKPDSQTITVQNHLSGNISYALEYRPPAPFSSGDHNFFFVWDAATSSAAVSTYVKQAGTNADAVQQTETNTVVAFAQNDTATLPLSYAFDSTNATQHYVVGLAASTAYGVSSSSSLVTVSSGGSDATTNSSGVLAFAIPSGGGGAEASINLAASPPSLSFSCTEGGSNPADQDVALTADGGTAAVSASDGAAWTTLALSGGADPQDTPQTLTVSVDCTGLVAASSPYSATISVSSATSGVTNSPLTIPVTLTVSVSPILAATPTQLSFTATAGSTNPNDQTLTATLSVSGDVSISDDAAWLSVSPTSDTSTTSTAITVSVNTSGLTAGTYNGTITITSADATGSPFTVPITLTLNPAVAGSLRKLVAVAYAGGAVIHVSHPGIPANTPCTWELSNSESVVNSGFTNVDSTFVVVAADTGAHQLTVNCGDLESTVSLTIPAASSSLTWNWYGTPPTGTTHVKLEYGGTTSLGSSTTQACSAGSLCKIPLVRDGGLTYIRHTYCGDDACSSVIATSEIEPRSVR